MYVFYRHRHDAARELVLRDGASFPRHLNRDEWYLHGTHASVNGRTESDIATLGFCDRNAGATFGRRVAAGVRPPLPTRGNDRR
ncbi:MAG TPA: hypothetical protein VGL35_03495 [Rhizomicrobium sp.]|jgi:hypothetical protein